MAWSELHFVMYFVMGKFNSDHGTDGSLKNWKGLTVPDYTIYQWGTASVKHPGRLVYNGVLMHGIVNQTLRKGTAWGFRRQRRTLAWCRLTSL